MHEIYDTEMQIKAVISNETLMSWSYSNEQLIICYLTGFLHITKESNVTPCLGNILVLLRMLFQEKRQIE